MKISTIIKGLIFILIIQSCTGGLSTTKLSQDGEAAYKAGNYELALSLWEQIIESKGKKTKAPVYVGAGKSALALDDVDNARYYLEKAKASGYSSPEMYDALAKVYRIVDNLSKEITALEMYSEKIPQGENISSIRARLLKTYVESENWDLGKDLWPELEDQAQSNADLLAGYLIINKNLENNTVCDKLAKQILKLEANNIAVLEYYAEKYFWKAENLYVTEMNAYKKKKTSSQYKKLLKALDVIWPNFKKSRTYFLRLYKIDPKKEYAKYLGKI
ncbi:tetratricopeptide repeat protein, partial [bacterium]|nr:tetratricopeptide repeat protein [bacterium]